MGGSSETPKLYYVIYEQPLKDLNLFIDLARMFIVLFFGGGVEKMGGPCSVRMGSCLGSCRS